MFRKVIFNIVVNVFPTRCSRRCSTNLSQIFLLPLIRTQTNRCTNWEVCTLTATETLSDTLLFNAEPFLFGARRTSSTFTDVCIEGRPPAYLNMPPQKRQIVQTVIHSAYVWCEHHEANLVKHESLLSWRALQMDQKQSMCLDQFISLQWCWCYHYKWWCTECNPSVSVKIWVKILQQNSWALRFI